jgi:multicomponent Na+:H+ antiporter subunit E
MTATLGRACAFFVLWLAVAGLKSSDLPVGVAVALAAAWASVALAPPSGGRLNVSAALLYLVHFLRLSLVSGLDVARRALAATPDLEPGMVEAPLVQPPGFARNAFSVIASLLPGSLLTGSEPDNEHLAYVHALDIRQPVAAELAAEEAAYLRTLGQDASP